MKNANYMDRCIIIDKIIPTNRELFEYRLCNNIYKSDWYLNLTKRIADMLNSGCHHFILTITPASLIAAEYISQQKESNLKYRKIKLHIIIPERDFLSFFNIKLSEYPNLLNQYTDVTILSSISKKYALNNAIQFIKSISGSILEI